MTGLSTVGALKPAFERTREMLLRSFPWERSLLIVLLASLISPSIELPDSVVPRFYSSGIEQIEHQWGGLGFAPGVKYLSIAIAVLLVVVLVIVLLMATCRAPFFLFDLVTRRKTGLKEAWRENGAAAWEWFLFNFLFGAGASIAAWIVSKIFHLLLSGSAHMAALERVGSVASSLVVLLFVIVTQDFVVAALVVGGGTATDALGRAISLTVSTPVDTLTYFAVKIGLIAVRVLASALLGAPVVWLMLKEAAPMLLRIAGASTRDGQTHLSPALVVGVFVVLLPFLVLVAIQGLTDGFSEVFFMAYALFFLSGRYPALREVMEEGGLLRPVMLPAGPALE